MNQKVTVRAYGGYCTQLIAVDKSDRLVYVVNPGSIARVEAGETEPVGVPTEDVTQGWKEEAAH